MDFVEAIKQAIVYPYRKENWKNTLLIPVLYQLALGIVLGVVGFVFVLILGMGGKVMGPITGLVMGVVYLAALIALLPFLGYHWTLIGNWQENGLDAPAPGWSGNVKTYFITGIHYLICIIILYIPMLIAMLSLGLLMPFVVSPLYMAAKERTVGSFFANIGSGIERARSKYVTLLIAIYLCVGIMLVAFIPIYILMLTIVGGFVAIMGLNVSFMHLITQAFMTDEEKEGAGSSRPASPINTQTFRPNTSWQK